jgi:hypothetical protein
LINFYEIQIWIDLSISRHPFHCHSRLIKHVGLHYPGSKASQKQSKHEPRIIEVCKARSLRLWRCFGFPTKCQQRQNKGMDAWMVGRVQTHGGAKFPLSSNKHCSSQLRCFRSCDYKLLYGQKKILRTFVWMQTARMRTNSRDEVPLGSFRCVMMWRMNEPYGSVAGWLAMDTIKCVSCVQLCVGLRLLTLGLCSVQSYYIYRAYTKEWCGFKSE